MTPEQDLDAYFGSMAATLGLHAGAWALIAPPDNVDALALSRKHDAAIHGADAWRKLRAVAHRVDAWRELEPDAWRVAALTFTPHRWPEHVYRGMHRCGSHLLDGSHSEACGKRGTMAGLLGLRTDAAVEWIDTPVRDRIMTVEARAATIVASVRRRLPKASQHEQVERETARELGLMFAPLRREAEGLLDGALTSYAAFRRGKMRRAERDEVAEARGALG